jgi:type I restriction enzyme S subunit
VDFDPVRAKAEGRHTGLPDEISDLFPDSFENSDLGEIPDGWEAPAIYELAHYINGASHSSMHLNDESRGLPVIKINELKSGITTQTRYWNSDYKQKHLVGTGDILFSWSGNPDTSIGTFVWSGPRGLLNQHIFQVVPKKANLRSFLLLLLKEKQPLFAEIARDKQTTGLGHVTIKDLKENHGALPDDSVLDVFSRIVDPLLRKCENQSLQISALMNIRNTLLPRLISGELRIPEAEQMLEEVGV